MVLIRLSQQVQSRAAVGGIIILVDLLQHQNRTVFQFDLAIGAFLEILKPHILSSAKVRNSLDWGFMLTPPGIRLQCFIAVVKRDARADHVNYSNSILRKSRLDELFHLLNISREGPRNKRRAADQGFHAKVKRRKQVDALVLQNQPLIACGRELSFGQSVTPIVLDDVDHRNIPANNVLKVTHTNAGSIAIAGNSKNFDRRIAKTSSRCQCGHTSM